MRSLFDAIPQRGLRRQEVACPADRLKLARLLFFFGCAFAHSKRSSTTQTVIPSGEGRRFFFPLRSCEAVSLRSDESLCSMQRKLKRRITRHSPLLLCRCSYTRRSAWRTHQSMLDRSPSACASLFPASP